LSSDPETGLVSSCDETTAADQRSLKSRICFVTESYIPAIHGSATQVRQLGLALTNLGHDVGVMTRLISNSDPRDETLDGVHIVRVGKARGTSSLAKYQMIPALFGALVRRRKTFDVLVVSDFGVLGPICVLFGRIFRKKCILRAASCGEMDGSYAYAYDKETKHLKRLIVKILATTRNIFLRRADMFLSISSAITPELLRCGVRRSKIVQFGNGIDLQRYIPVQAETKSDLRKELQLPDAFIFMNCGRIAHGKGLFYLLDAWRRHDELQPGSCLVFVGSCQGFSMDCEPELRSLVSKFGIENRVFFTGAVQNVEQYLQAADVFVFPTEWEALGNSAIEAIASGLPIIGSAVGGVPDIIHDGKNGILTAVGDTTAICEAMYRVRNDKLLADGFATMSRKIALRSFDLAKKGRELSELIDNLRIGGG